MKYLSVYRLENDLIFCEDDEKNSYIFLSEDISEKEYKILKEGDILKLSDDDKLFIDKNETIKRKNNINELRKKLMNIKN